MEEQLPTAFTEGQVTKFVQNHEVLPCKAFSKFASSVVEFLLFQSVDQIDKIEEPSPFTVSDCLTP